jgi:hypothetical protein
VVASEPSHTRMKLSVKLMDTQRPKMADAVLSCCPRLPASQAVTVGLYHAVDTCKLFIRSRAEGGQWTVVSGIEGFCYNGFNEKRRACSSVTNLEIIVRFQVLTAASVKFRAFWEVAPCSHVEVDRRFGGVYCLNHQGDLTRPFQ